MNKLTNVVLCVFFSAFIVSNARGGQWGTIGNWNIEHYPGGCHSKASFPNGTLMGFIVASDDMIDLAIEFPGAAIPEGNHPVQFRLDGGAWLSMAATAMGSSVIIIPLSLDARNVDALIKGNLISIRFGLETYHYGLKDTSKVIPELVRCYVANR